MTLDVALVDALQIGRGQRLQLREAPVDLRRITGGGIGMRQLAPLAQHAVEFAVEFGFAAGLDPLQRVGVDALRFEARETGLDRRPHLVERTAVEAARAHQECARDLTAHQAGADRRRHPLLVDDHRVERCFLAVGEIARQRFQCDRIGMRFLDRRPGQAEFRQLGVVVLVHQPDITRECCRTRRRAFGCGTTRNFAEVFLHPGPRLRRVEIAGDHQRGIVGRVPAAVERLHIVERGRIEIGQRADHRPVVGMVLGIQRVEHHRIGVAIGAVVDALPLLVLDDLLFLLDHRIGHGIDEPAELVGLGPEHLFQRVVGDGLQIVGDVVAGRTIGAAAADARAHAVQAAGAEVLRIEEEQMLEHVRKARASGCLARRPYVHGQHDCGHRIGAVDVEDHFKPVVEGEGLHRHQGAGRCDIAMQCGDRLGGQCERCGQAQRDRQQ